MKENGILPPYTLLEFLNDYGLTDTVTATFVRFGEEIWVAREKELNPSTFVQTLINHTSDKTHPARYGHHSVTDLGLLHMHQQEVAFLGGDDRYKTAHHTGARIETYALADEQIAHYNQGLPRFLSNLYFALDSSSRPVLKSEPETE